jgi:hypothetical protein
MKEGAVKLLVRDSESGNLGMKIDGSENGGIFLNPWIL